MLHCTVHLYHNNSAGLYRPIPKDMVPLWQESYYAMPKYVLLSYVPIQVLLGI